MRLCCNCFEELLDRETTCPICNNNITLDNNQTKEFYLLVNEVRTANNFKRNFLKKDPKYELVFRYINYRKDHPKNINYNRPKILDISSHKNINETTEEYWNRINKHIINMPQQSKPEVTCPYCQSTNTKKISTMSKAGSVALFGIFSQKVKHQWHCNECGSDF